MEPHQLALKASTFFAAVLETLVEIVALAVAAAMQVSALRGRSVCWDRRFPQLRNELRCPQQVVFQTLESQEEAEIHELLSSLRQMTQMSAD